MLYEVLYEEINKLPRTISLLKEILYHPIPLNVQDTLMHEYWFW